jgi:HNH endonuclease
LRASIYDGCRNRSKLLKKTVKPLSTDIDKLVLEKKLAFSAKVKDQVLVSCARHCCICHRFVGLKIELHHIVQIAEGGEDSINNCIPLCFECHADMRSYDHRHPKGTKYTRSELILHRENWYKKISNPNLSSYNEKTNSFDKLLFEKLIDKIEIDTIKFIDGHDFGTMFEKKYIDKMHDYISINETAFDEFIDPELETLRVALKKSCWVFIEFLSTNTWRVQEHTGFRSVPAEWEDQQPNRLIVVSAELNRLSQLVVLAFNELVRTARRKLNSH